jgi:hypothetical protein
LARDVAVDTDLGRKRVQRLGPELGDASFDGLLRGKRRAAVAVG